MRKLFLSFYLLSILVALMIADSAFASELYDAYDGKLVGTQFIFTANGSSGYVLTCRDDKLEILTPDKKAISISENDCKDLQGLLLIADAKNVVRLQVESNQLTSKEPLFDVDAQTIKAKKRK